VPALRDVSLDVGHAEIYGLAGPNGSGKTTLLRILATLVSPTTGDATVGGESVVASPLLVRRIIGVSNGEGRSLYWRLTARQNLEFFAGMYRLRDAAARIDELLRMFQLSAAADRPVGGFSQGMLQRLALARALLHKPPILLLDEPTKSLDPLAAAEFRELLLGLHTSQGTTIVLASHDLEEVVQLCNRVAVLRAGSIAAELMKPSRNQLLDAMQQHGGAA
jgi:ABC-type multidrug transport system ATPase subunit